jgi:hypothetical protein
LRLEEQERNRLQIINANKTSKGNYWLFRKNAKFFDLELRKVIFQ